MLGLRYHFDNGGRWETVPSAVFRALGLAAATGLSVMVAAEQSGEVGSARTPVALRVSDRSTLDCVMEVSPEGERPPARGECDLYRNLLKNSRPRQVRVPDLRRNTAVKDERSTTDEGAESSYRAVPSPDGSLGSDLPEVQASGEPRLFVDAIIQHPGLLCIGGVNSLPASVADAIRRRLSPTELPHVDVLTVEVASVLTQHGGVQSTVWFESIGRVEPGAIEALLEMDIITLKDKPGTRRPAALIILPSDLRNILPVEQVQAIEAHTSIHFGTQHVPR